MNSPLDFISIEPIGETLVIRPLANLSEFQYQHIEESVGQVIQALDKSGLCHVVIDFTETTYFGSSAVEAIIRIGREVKRRGGTMRLENLTEAEREVLAILHVDTLWPISVRPA